MFRTKKKMSKKEGKIFEISVLTTGGIERIPVEHYENVNKNSLMYRIDSESFIEKYRSIVKELKNQER